MTPMDTIRKPAFWRGLSTIALVVAIIGIVVGGDFGWIAALLSGLFFLVEIALKKFDSPDR